MDNKTIYKKTLGFSLRRVLWDLLSLVILGGLGTLGFFIAEKSFDSGLIGLAIGLLIGLVIIIIVLRFVSYYLKAGQIAMITKGVTEGSLPDNVIAEGKKAVKERFLTVAAYFAVTRVIKGIFNQIGRGITKLGESIGGDAGGAVGSAVNTVIQTVVAYLCDCCLGWVFFRKEVKAAKATCEGAVLFFKHGKTLAKNMGRVFGIGLVTLLIIGGIFGGITYFVLSTQQQALAGLYNEIAQAFQNSDSSIARILQNPATVPIALSVLAGIIVWAIIHSTFIRPFVLTGVLRNYLESGMNDIPSESSFALLDSKSAKFKKLHSEI
ncbi:MAG: hypothetical protein IJT00_06535 [Lachnospiraceae bacterium]|nr:hypothetical protein [Lachnospiraceae bacterium]